MNTKIKKLIRMIKFTPLVAVLFLSVLIMSIMYQEHKEDFKDEIIFSQAQYIKSEKERIYNITNTIVNYINGEKEKSEEKLKKDLNSKINIVHKIMTNIYNKNKDTLSKELIIKLIKDTIVTMRYDEGRGYFSIHTLEGINVLHPINPSFEGTSVLNRKNSKGRYSVKEAINIVKTKGEGFLTWYYSKPNDKSKEFKKVGIVKKFEPYNFIITTAIYIDDYEKALQKNILSTLSSFKYKDDGFITVIDYTGNILLHPSKKVLNHNLLEDGKFLHLRKFYKKFILDKENKNGDFISIKPIITLGKDTKETKIIYSKKFDGWKWIVASSFKLSDANKIIEQRKEFLTNRYNNHMTNMFIYGITSTFILIIISFFIAKLIEKRFLEYRQREEEQIKEKMKVKDELLEISKKLTNVSENIPGVIYTFQLFTNGKSCFPYSSDHIYDIYGVSSEEVKTDTTKAFESIHLEDREGVAKSIQISSENLTIWEDEYRVNHPVKGTIWVKGMSKPERQLDGSVLWYGYIYDITKYKMSELEIKNAKNYYETLLEYASDGIHILNLKGNVISYSRSFAEHLGYKYEEVETLNISDWDSSVTKEHVADIISDTSRKARIFETKYIKKDGTIVDVQISAKGIELDGKLCIYSSVRDISERKEMERQLAQEREQFETIFNEAPNPIMLHDEDGKVLMVNKVWETLTGYSFEEINTIEKWTKNAYGEQMSVVKEYIDDLHDINSIVKSVEYSINTKDGNIITWQFSSAPMGIIDNKRTIISSAMDITELKLKDEMLIAQSRSAAMGEMIGMIAHQWRQPLTVISMGANNMLLDITLEELNLKEVEEYSRDILTQTTNLSKTIDDFRNFFKPDKSILKVKVKDILDETYEIVKDSLKNHNIKFNKSYKSETKIDAYPRELMQVFVNIINNSKDAIILKECKNAQIDVCIFENDTYVITEICDNGKGIDAKILPNIFDPYFTTKDDKTGTGLGLYMSKMIINDHLNGKIDVFNKNDGVCFSIKLRKDTLK